MNNSPFNQIKDFDSLLQNKSFEELSPAEQAAITEVMPAAEYTAMRQILLTSKRLFADEEKSLGSAPPLTAMLKSVSASHATNNSSKWRYLISLLTLRIPVYQAGIVACLVALVVFFSPHKDTERVIFRTGIDTVFITPALSPQPSSALTGNNQTTRISMRNTIQKPAKQPGRLQSVTAGNNIPQVPALSGREKETFVNVTQIASRQRCGSTVLSDSNLYRILVTSL